MHLLDVGMAWAVSMAFEKYTIVGMVEMFGSMQGALGPDGESTVAGGISTALVTTQLGLVIAVPGLVASHFLTRLQVRREQDLKDVVRSLQGASS